MSTQNQDSSKSWAPESWSLHGNPTEVLETLRSKAEVRGDFSPYELGTDAGRFVLDQYYNAKGDTGKGTIIKSALSLPNMTNILAGLLPLGGFVAALGVDYQIFGSAAKDIAKTDLPFNAFAVGSLIFAGGLGLAEKYNSRVKTSVMYGTLAVASLGASFIAANDSKLRENFTASLANIVDKGSDDEQRKVSSLEIEIAAIKLRIDEKQKRLSSGGNGGKHMLADGNPGNDVEGNTILADIKQLDINFQTKNVTLGTEKANLTQAQRKDPVEFIGRITAAGYISAWLMAAQFLVAEIVRRSGRVYSEFRQNIAKGQMQKKFLEGIENPDEIIRKNAIYAAVSSALSRFSEILSNAKAETRNPDKHENFAKLFDMNPYVEMEKIATDMVLKGIVVNRPRSSFIDTLRGMFNKKSSSETAPETAAGQPTKPTSGNTDGQENDLRPGMDS